MTSSSVARRVWAIVPAAGRGARFDAAAAHGTVSADAPPAPKQYAPLAGATVIEWSVRPLLAEPRVAGIVVVVAEGDAHWPRLATALGQQPGVAGGKLHSTSGGASRQDSVTAGLAYLERFVSADDWVLVHDAARPCLSGADLGALLDALGGRPGERDAAPVGAILAAPVVDTVKRGRGGAIVETVSRDGLWRAMTPQVFGFAALRQALQDAAAAGVTVTDEAQAMERMGLRAVLVPCSPFNIKVTRADDLPMAAGILKLTGAGNMRIGQGIDVHAYGEGDHVVLGGVRIDYARGVVAHSDGDVVIHALCDALLGALGDGDIGQHFPDTDPRYRGADSRLFLRETAARVQAAGLRVVNADITVLAEAPRIAKHRPAMCANLAADLGVAVQLINIKATTTERLGFIGRGEGLAASAVVLLE